MFTIAVSILAVTVVGFIIMIGVELYAMRHDGESPDMLITLAWFGIVLIAVALCLGAST